MNTSGNSQSAHYQRDRVAQVYFGMVQWGAAADILRKRIDWMAAQVKGPTILDVGCSEGVLEILLARKGFHITGVDVNAEAIEFAQDLLAQEPDEVQRRVRFVHGDLAKRRLLDDRFDTLVMGETLEHLKEPKPLLDRCLDLLHPEGRVIITTPFGYHPYEDHWQTFCLTDFLMLFKSRCHVEQLQVEDGYIRMVGHLLNSSKSTTQRRLNSKRLLGITETALVSSQKGLYRTIAHKESRVQSLKSELEAKKHELEQFRADNQTMLKAVEALHAETDELQKEVQTERLRASKLYGDLKDAKEFEVQLKESIRWQLGTLCVDAAGHPWRSIRLPLDVIRLALHGYARRDKYSRIEDNSSKSPQPSQSLSSLRSNARSAPAFDAEPVATAKVKRCVAHEQSTENLTDWVIDHVEGAEVTVLGSDRQALLRSLENVRVKATLHEFGFLQGEAKSPKLQWPSSSEAASSLNLPRTNPIEEDAVLPNSANRADTAILWCMPQGGVELDTILCWIRDRLCRPQAKVIIASEKFEAFSEQGREFELSTLLAALGATTVPEYLSLANNELRFVGHFNEPCGDAWSRFEAEVWPRLMNEVVESLRSTQRREVRAIQQRVDDLLHSTSFKAGRVLVESAKEPRLIWRAPLRLLRLYRSSRVRTRPRAAPHSPVARGSTATLPPLTLPTPDTSGVPTVAAILDTFTEYCLRYEADLVLVTPKRWRQQIERSKPALLLVESAWRGNNGAWKYALEQYATRQVNPLRELIQYCRDKNIPTAFWNKEDPPNFDVFIDVAREFDFVFTTDTDCIPKYRKLCGHDRIHLMMFACQPRLHNPYREQSWPRSPVCFAGSWMEKYPERKQSLENLLAPALAFGLHIFDRNFKVAGYDSRYQFPERYQDSIKGSLDYESMLTAYRCYDVMLNVNSVTDSPTMFSRRVFESIACGTPVISTDSLGLREVLGDYTRITHSSEDTTTHLNELLNDEERRMREGHLGYRYAHEHHTYERRMHEMLEKVGLETDSSIRRPSISVVIATCRPENVKHAVANFYKQCYESKELLLVLNNAKFDLNEVRNLVGELEHVHVLEVRGAPTLGECINRGVQASSGDYVAKMDDDDIYGERYLADIMLAASYTEADILGKATYFTYVEGENVTALRCVGPAHQLTTLVAGATLTAPREVWRQFPQPDQTGGENAKMLESARKEGCRIYSADPFNFVAVRRANLNSHTWRIADDCFLNNCRNKRSGLDLDHIMI